MLLTLVVTQDNRCHYCNCDMNNVVGSPQQATIEHLVDKWSSPKHTKIETFSNLVASCTQCNNQRGAIRNRIARKYYKRQADIKRIKVAVSSTSSKTLYKLFGPVPQHLFNTV
jgi:hypothetical protein